MLDCSTKLIPTFTVTTVGFDMEEYSVSESDGIVMLSVSVLSGSIETSFPLELTLSGGSAMCKL